MSVWQAIRRATLLIPSGPQHDPERKHLHIVLNNPHPDATGADKVLVVSVTGIPTHWQGYDPSCTLYPGEHPFIVKHSYVAYRYLELVDPAHLASQVQAKKFVAKPLLDEKFFAAVIQGLRDSPQTQPRFLRFFDSTLDDSA